MASVRPHKVRLCRPCKAADRTKPAGGDGCNCKVLSWRVFWRTPDGDKRSEVFALARDANDKKAEVESTTRRGTYVDSSHGRQLFADFADEWAEAQAWKANSRQQWPARRARIVAAVGEKARLGDVDLLAVQRARNHLSERYAYNTAKGAMHLLVGILRAAAASGRIPRDPTAGRKDLGPVRRADDTSGVVTPDMVPTRAEALAILSSAPAGYRAAVALGLAGLRVSEATGMQRSRIQLDARLVTVDRQALELRGQPVTLTTPKAEKVRTIKVPALVAVELRRHLRSVDGELLFPADNGDPFRSGKFYTVAWYPALKAAGLSTKADDGTTVRRFKWHALRHFCASNLLANGAPLPAVAGHLGDTVETITSTYAHWLRDDKDLPAEILDKVLAPAEPVASRMPHAEAGGDR